MYESQINCDSKKGRLEPHYDMDKLLLLTHPCPNFNGGLIKPPLKAVLRLVITSHRKIWVKGSY